MDGGAAPRETGGVVKVGTSTVFGDRWRPAAIAAVVVTLVVVGIVTTVLLRSGDEHAAVPSSLVPDPECVALVGDEPWIILSGPASSDCVVAADFQNVRAFNKGHETVTLAWPGGDRTLGIDESFFTGPIGEVLQAGPNEISSSPPWMPAVWVLPEALSPTAVFESTEDGFGPARIGMTLDDAAAALGLDIEVGRNLAPGPECWHAVVPGDPYSPTFVVVGAGDGTSVVTAILLHGTAGSGPAAEVLGC